MSQVETNEGRLDGESELIAWLRDNDLMDAKDNLLNMRRPVTLEYLKEFDPMFLNGFIKSDLKLDGMLAYDFSKAVSKLRESSNANTTTTKEIVRIVLSQEEDNAITEINQKYANVLVYIKQLKKDIDGLTNVSKEIEAKINQFEQKSINKIKSRMNELRKQANVEINKTKEQISNHLQKGVEYMKLLNEAQNKQNTLLIDDKLDKLKRKTKILDVNKSVLNENDMMKNKLNYNGLITVDFDKISFFKSIENVGRVNNNNYPNPPIVIVKNVMSSEAIVEFTEVKSELECCIEISCVDEDEKGNWNTVATIKNKNTYKITNLQSDKSYKVRSKYKNQSGWSNYSQIASFKTKTLTSYQDLNCWKCGTSKGKMIICNNVQNPDRNDAFGRDGYSALCAAHEKLIGTHSGYKSRAT